MQNRKPSLNWTALRQADRDGIPIMCLYGGTSSGKTYSAIMWCIRTAYAATIAEKPFKACICRRTYPELEQACWDVALQILDDLRLIQSGVADIRKSPRPQIRFGKGVYIDFRHAETHKKIKGAEYDVWLLDEVTDISPEFYEETKIRVPRSDKRRFLYVSRIILTWNPTSLASWVYEEFFTGKPQDVPVRIVKSTYLDNPHVLPRIVAQLHSWQVTDPRRWQVYGLGDWGSPDELIYPKWSLCPDDNQPATGRKYDAVGIDFGYANPTAVVGIFVDSGRIVADEILYRSGMPISDLCAWAAERPELRGVPVFCDPSAPASIDDLQRAGLAAEPANNDVQPGISWLQARPIHLTHRSTSLKREIAGYAWQKDAEGRIIDKPVKIMDHACDAMRYAAYTWHVQGYDAAYPEYAGFLG